ncbi:MAG TPA: kelch repeat-containing protein, partial [Myxococcaceae bacterium]|nr:kelch repeat-containing protein [Myxococcaceae bacterium]
MNRVSKSCALLSLITLVFSCSSAPPAEEGVGVGLLLEVSEEARLTTARKQAPLVVLEDGRVLAAGGKDGPRTLRSSEVYEPRTGEWRETGRLNQERREHAAVVLGDGRVLV